MSIYISKDDSKKVRFRAAREKTSVSDVVRRSLNLYLDLPMEKVEHES